VSQQLVPATRLGLVLGIVGFALAVALTASDTAVAALGSVYSLPWVLLVIVMVYPARLIRPGTGWSRSLCRKAPAAVLYGVAVVVALSGALLAASSGPAPAIIATIATLAIAVVAATLPSVTRAAEAPTTH
jgi:hypothetical protein